ncbi:MAG: hypothetical protein U1F36_01820 [Planctomycetota bacterium]
MRSLSLVCFAAMSAALSAQTVITSPAGLDAVEGNTVFSHWSSSRRFQQVDASHEGNILLISGLAWRRNGNVTQTSAGPRTFDLTVDFGDGNFGQLSSLLDENHLPTTRQTVFGPTTVNFPDWNPSAVGPAPFDFAVTFPGPYVYTGNHALVIDFSYANNTSTALAQTDRDFNGYTTPTAGTSLGTGCIATGRTSAFSHTASMVNLANTPVADYGMRFRFGGANAPASTPVVLNIDFVNQNLAGIACSTLYAFPTVSVTRMSSSTGALADLDFGFTYDPNLLGATLFTQLLAFDAGQSPLPIVVSNGRQTTMPATPGFTNGHRCAYAWYGLPSTTGTATVFVGGGMVMQLM